jgi:hypothetical protein
MIEQAVAATRLTVVTPGLTPRHPATIAVS